jgi:hypothetical protein
MWGEGKMNPTVANAVGLGVRENTVLVEVCERTRLVDERGREAIRVGLVISELCVHEVVNLKIENGISMVHR